MCSAFNTSSRTLGHSGFNPATVVPIDRTENNNIIIYGRIICELTKFVLLYPLSRPPVPFDFSLLSHLHRFRDDTVDLSAIGNLLTDFPTSSSVFTRNRIKTNKIFFRIR